MGPMVAAARFLDAAARRRRPRSPAPAPAARLGARLHGSLAFTGKGHATDRAVILGLAGFDPDDLRRRPRRGGAAPRSPRPAGSTPPGLPPLAFDPDARPRLRLRPAAARPRQRHGALGLGRRRQPAPHARPTIPSAAASSSPRASSTAPPPRPAGPRRALPLRHRRRDARDGATPAASAIAAMKRANELAGRDAAALDAGLARLWAVMVGLHRPRPRRPAGELPGGLRVRRRAGAIHDAPAGRARHATSPRRTPSTTGSRSTPSR